MDVMMSSGISPADQISDLRKQQDLPFVRADSEGIVREINAERPIPLRFTGLLAAQLVGRREPGMAK